MDNIVVKTIWQSKEINEAGDTSMGAESHPQSGKEQMGKSTTIKVFPKKKKAVSFHGVEPYLTSKSPNLSLKRSSASTNISLLNLADGEHEDPTSENKPSDYGGPPAGAAGERKDPSFPVEATWSEDESDTPMQQEMSNSGLLQAKDSITSLKERASKVNHIVQNLQSEYTALSENLEQSQREAEHLEGHCTQLKSECTALCDNLDRCWQEAKVLEESCTQIKEKLCFLQQQLDAEDLSQQVKPLLEDVSQHLSAFKPLDSLEKYPASCTRCASYTFVNTEMLRQMVENAVAPILEELKQRTPPLSTCPSCQHLQKTMDQKQSTLEIYTKAEVLDPKSSCPAKFVTPANNEYEK